MTDGIKINSPRKIERMGPAEPERVDTEADTGRLPTVPPSSPPWQAPGSNSNSNRPAQPAASAPYYGPEEWGGGSTFTPVGPEALQHADAGGRRRGPLATALAVVGAGVSVVGTIALGGWVASELFGNEGPSPAPGAPSSSPSADASPGSGRRSNDTRPDTSVRQASPSPSDASVPSAPPPGTVEERPIDRPPVPPPGFGEIEGSEQPSPAETAPAEDLAPGGAPAPAVPVPPDGPGVDDFQSVVIPPEPSEPAVAPDPAPSPSAAATSEPTAAAPSPEPTAAPSPTANAGASAASGETNAPATGAPSSAPTDTTSETARG